jgi:hypothetical protein
MNDLLTRKNFWIITINSTTAFVLAYLIIFYVNQLSFILTGGMYDYPVSIDYATYFYHIEPYVWTHDSVILIFTAGYIMTLFVGIFSLLGFFYLLADAMPIKALFFWLFMHSSTYFFGGLMVGNLLTEGIGHVFNWMYLTDTVKMIISLIGFFGLLITALASSRLSALLANSYFEKYSEKIGPFYITGQVLLPYIFGSLLLYFYYFPKNMFHEKYGWMIMGAMMIIFFIRAQFQQDLLFEEDDNRSIRPMTALIVLTVVILVVSRAVLFRPVLIN